MAFWKVGRTSAVCCGGRIIGLSAVYLILFAWWQQCLTYNFAIWELFRNSFFLSLALVIGHFPSITIRSCLIIFVWPLVNAFLKSRTSVVVAKLLVFPQSISSSTLDDSNIWHIILRSGNCFVTLFFFHGPFLLAIFSFDHEKITPYLQIAKKESQFMEAISLPLTTWTNLRKI